MAESLRPIFWQEDHLVLLDQTKLPTVEEYVDIRTVDQLIDAIQRLVVRGAPALGAAGGYGVAIALLQAKQVGWSEPQLAAALDSIETARPTAVNLAWGVKRVRQQLPLGFPAVLAEADAIAAEDASANHQMAEVGADWLVAKLSHILATRKLRLLTHCNTGTLATTEWGTALGVIRLLHERGLVELVYADETRPLLQGSRLTAWELARLGIPHLVQTDGAAASTVLRGLVDAALIGADRIAANGDSANKIGSVSVALATARAGVPFLVVAPVSTVDLATASGVEIEIEQRPSTEVVQFAGVQVAPVDTVGFNPAFDVTPADLISAIITEQGAIELSAGQTPAGFLQH